jgi:peroxiredoxin
MLLNTPICNFGWQAPSFSLQGIDGKTYTLEQQMGDKGLLIAFICNHCPYVKAIAERFSEDMRELQAAGINVVAIMSNDYQNYEADSPKNMKIFSEQYDFSFPYLIDEDQTIGKKYDAICTPDFFGFNHKGELQYRGRLDNTSVNSTTEEIQQREKELVHAMLQVAETGKGPEQQFASMGCSIKWR